MNATITRDELNRVASTLYCSPTDIKAIGPVRLYKAVPSALGSYWQYTGACGIASVIVDTVHNYVSLYIVSLISGTVVLRQECYQSFEYRVLSPHMHSFEGDDAVYGLNFAEGFDPTSFSTTLKGLITLCSMSQQPTQLMAPHIQYSNSVQPVPQPPNAYTVDQNHGKRGSLKSKIKNLFHRKHKEQPRPTVSAATNFRHTGHLGFKLDDGFGDVPPEWRNIFQKAGISEEDLKNKKTAKMLTKTITNMNHESQLPPPPTVQHTVVQSQQPQLPRIPPVQQPVQMQTQEVVTQVQVNAQPQPMIPTPPIATDAISKPKKAGPPVPPRAPKIEVSETEEVNTRPARGDDFLSAIKSAKLKPSDKMPQVSEMSEMEQDSLVFKIREAMEKIRPVMGEDLDDVESSEDSDEEW